MIFSLLHLRQTQQYMRGNAGFPSKDVGGVQELALCMSGLFRNRACDW